MENIIKWYLTLLVISIATLPITTKLFKNLKDGGYIFTKTVGLAISRLDNVVSFYSTFAKIHHLEYLYMFDPYYSSFYDNSTKGKK